MTLKELSDIMQKHDIGLVSSQKEAFKYAGVDCIEYDFTEKLISLARANLCPPLDDGGLCVPTLRTDIELTTEPIAGELLLQAQWEETWCIFDVYRLSNGDSVNICSKMLYTLFGSRPKFLYLTKVENTK